MFSHEKKRKCYCLFYRKLFLKQIPGSSKCGCGNKNGVIPLAISNKGLVPMQQTVKADACTHVQLLLNKHDLKKFPFILVTKHFLHLKTAQPQFFYLLLHCPCHAFRQKVLGKQMPSFVSSFITTQPVIHAGCIRLCATPNRALFS